MGGACSPTSAPPPPPPPAPDLPGGVENTARWPPNVHVRWGFDKEKPEPERKQVKPTPAPPPPPVEVRGEPVPLRVIPWAPIATTRVSTPHLWLTACIAAPRAVRAAARICASAVPRVSSAGRLGVVVALSAVVAPDVTLVNDDRTDARAAQRRRNQLAAARLAAKYLLDDE
jgi:hypothetical protein